MDGAVLLRRDDHSNDLIVHFLNQVSRLLDCDSAQDFKAEGYRCKMRDSVMEHFHLNYGLSLTVFRRLKRHEPRSTLGITTPQSLAPPNCLQMVQGVRYA